MTYNPLIPQPTDLLSNSQPQILTNFGQLNAQYGVDHVAFNTGSSNGDGTHKKITFDNATSPIPSPAGTVSNLYPALVSTEQEAIWKNATHTTQITSGGLPIWKGGTIGTSGVVTATTGGNDSNGSMTLGNGIILKWGSLSVPQATNQAYAFPVAFPTACFVVIPSCGASSVQNAQSASIVTSTITAAGFTVKQDSGSSSRTVRYFAVGI